MFPKRNRRFSFGYTTTCIRSEAIPCEIIVPPCVRGLCVRVVGCGLPVRAVWVVESPLAASTEKKSARIAAPSNVVG